MTAQSSSARASWRPRLPAAPDSVLGIARRQGRPAWGEGLHALWSMWVFVVPLFTPAGYDLRWLMLTLASYPLFLALFAGALVLPARRAPWCALAMILLCLVLLPWYVSGLSYFVFGCVFLGVLARASLWRYVLMLAVLNALLMGWARVLGYPWPVLVWMPMTTMVIGLLVHVERLRHVQDAALRLSHDEVRRLAAVAERERIGRDLHDLLGHTLSMVALKADLAAKLMARDRDGAQREIVEVGSIARDALSQVREAVSGIRAAGLAGELAAARLLLETDGVAFDYALDAAASHARLPQAVETALALALREGVTNVQRHARAHRVRVDITGEPAGDRPGGDGEAAVLRMRLRDDGRGGAIAPGHGLTGMRERFEALGGRVRIDSGAAGTCLEVWVPLDATRHVPATREAAR
ncbi:sensor histidine kinase [Luteimonas abyssi]|uniref:sensor histidine kinase n=1 Tax=Luteimonas abyssi TaxID=1247514 RepID=UPI000737ACFD|nr:sensor histidine kinase [Luteimonas abyssi]